MGLDLYIYKVNKSVEPTWENINYDNENCEEIAYARKAWEVCNFFGAANAKNQMVKITIDSWAEFVDKLAPIGIYLEEIWDAYYKYEHTPVDFPEEVLTKREKQLIATYELWYDENWDDWPMLGYFFSVGYMLEFWNKAEEIFSLLEGDEYDVYMLASF